MVIAKKIGVLLERRKHFALDTFCFRPKVTFTLSADDLSSMDVPESSVTSAFDLLGDLDMPSALDNPIMMPMYSVKRKVLTMVLQLNSCFLVAFSTCSSCR